MIDDWRRICDEFVRVTAYDQRTIDERWRGRSYDPSAPVPRFAIEARARVALGAPRFPEGGPDVWAVLANRRSKRNYLPEPLTLDELNLLLWATQGATGEAWGRDLRAAPSAGALYPLETWVFAQRVEGIEPGLYHLDVEAWALDALVLGDVDLAAYTVAYEQEHVRHAGASFLWTAVIERCRRKYFERAYRYVWWDAGHVAENLHLAATALGLGSVSMGAWYDAQAHALLGIDGVEHFSALMACVGRVEGEDWRADRRWRG